MSLKHRALVGLAVVVAGLASCAKKAPEGDPLEPVMRASWEKMSQGLTNEALAVLEKAYTQKSLRPQRPVLLRELVFFQLRLEQPAAARARVLTAIRQDAAMAAPVLGIVEAYLFEKREYAELVAWCHELAALPLEEGAQAPLSNWEVRALYADGKADDAFAALQAAVPRYAAPTALRLAVSAAEWLVGAGNAEQAERVIDYVETQMPASPERESLTAGLRVGLLTGQGKWDEASALFAERAPKLADGDAAGLLDRLTRSAIQAGKAAVVDAVCEPVLKGPADRATTRATAARWWVQSALGAGDMAALTQRLAALDSFGLPLPVVMDQLDMTYTEILGKGAPADMKALLAFAETLQPRLTQDVEKAQLAGIMLDASFCAQEFKTALRLLEAGVPTHDAEWHAMLIPKVKAHIAQQEGRLDDAVAEYRAFMARIEKDQKDQVDPIAGGRVTWEMILGLNARRIAELLTSAGKADEAAKALAEARGFYEKALARLDANSPEHKQVTETLKELSATP
jgi:hypothetical protein